jgi:4-alpha-glucanotransferase
MGVLEHMTKASIAMTTQTCACMPPVVAYFAVQELGLIGLRIQRMPSEQGLEFNNPATYPYLSVASPSCHDVSPLRAWCAPVAAAAVQNSCQNSSLDLMLGLMRLSTTAAPAHTCKLV